MYFSEKKIKSYKKIKSRILLIFEKIISLLITFCIAERLSFEEIGFWSQIIFAASLYTSVFGLNVSNGIIAIVPRIKRYKEKFELIFKSGLILFLISFVGSLLLISFKDVFEKLLFNNSLNIYYILIILGIGAVEMLLEFILYAYRSLKDFEASNMILTLRMIPRITIFVGIFKSDLNLMLNLFFNTYVLLFIFLILYLIYIHKSNVIYVLSDRINIDVFFNPEPHLKSVFTLSRKSILANLTAGFFFFILRSLLTTNNGLEAVGKFSLALSAGATVLSLTTFIGFTFYPYISSLAIEDIKSAFLKTNNLSIKIIYSSIFISLFVTLLKINFGNLLNFYPFTIDSINFFLAILGYGFLSAYQISQPFAFALTNNIKVIRIEMISLFISLGLLSLILISVKDLNNSYALICFFVYSASNYLQVRRRNLLIYKNNI